MKRSRKKRRLWLLLPFIVVMVILFYNSNWMGKMVHPIHYQEEITKYAEQYGLDPFLVAAIIRVESNYKPEAESKKGAVGLMQLMPETADWIFEKEGSKVYDVKDLRNPVINIQAGTSYLNFLFNYFDNNRFEVLAAYNAGQGNVMKWKQSGIWDGTLQNVDRIPFRETRNYVSSVDYYYKKYMEIYAKER
ncbi:lytic transglycosylase domain-containing protein [Paenibacillus sp. J2TS4]|uniref:lytic transglycosylase domain-containing protein n=1 Tax=Paenibacillus sp. J2TS4 TaxID=2807194 RepID=UPI001B1D75A9|nr:lytic transglycosylase domain-containing protein [Paenibacillus sp. J2TS4]GIP33738.1 transglycosylase [Paenibacillus sp. J2TS4]